jgi:hypothetical protein
MTDSRARRFFKGLLIYGLIIVITLAVLDGLMMALGLFPPTHNYGDAQLGWRSAPATGRQNQNNCTEYSTGERILYDRNEDGVRTGLSRSQIEADTTHVKIGVTGDSQTDLCATNQQIHAGVLESELVARGVPAQSFSFGSGRYSPLQDYLAFKYVLRPYQPTVFVMNVYTGNDLYDILRVDDRPHFEATETGGYEIAPPVWLLLDDPAVKRKSRVLFAMRQLAVKSGARSIFVRTLELRRLASQYGGGMGTIIGYMRSLYEARDPALGYPDAFSAQMLNQQLFFHYFPKGKAESLNRMRALMELVRAENPGVTLVMSPIPSYELLGEQPVDSPLTRTLARLPITYDEGRAQEQELYDGLRALATEQQWVFVDNLAALRAYTGTERLFNDFDYHLLPVASAIVGKAQAEAVAPKLVLRAAQPK